MDLEALSKGHRDSRDHFAPKQTTPAPTPTGPWICFNPSTDPVHGPGNAAGEGILSPRPGMLGNAFTAFAPVAATSTGLAQPNWDQAGLVSALNVMSL